MTEHAKNAEAIFLAALDKATTQERAAYIEGACAENAQLLRRLHELLDCHQESRGPLDVPPPGLGGIVDVPPISERPGTIIGPYKLLEQIGEGGMGLVFVAEQQRPVKRRVALKVIKPGMDSRQVLARFEAERQALAMMDHANIAKVHDGGTTEGGRPYFVMELVKGKPITDYCDKHRLTTRQRLELFLDVCHAVQHAHQKGIIHRDLKPSNVLVSHYDVRPVVKVIDFGVAKATGTRLTDQSIYTGVAQMIGTPLYMAPEQAGLSDLDVDTRSDVYALGVLLYELLTGTTPFEGETLRKVGYDEMRRIIREDEPPRPSTRLSTMQQAALSTIEEKRGSEPRRLSQQVRGELDWIVMKALEKDRNRRYESASALAADVQRYLRDEPVEACPPSTSYRLRKFTRRNRRSIVTAGVIAVALVAATVVSVWQAVVARDAQHQAEVDRKQAEADRDRAKTAERQAKTEQDRAKAAERQAATDAAIAKAVADFLQQDLLRQVDMGAQRGGGFVPERNLTVKEALDRAAGRIGQRFNDQPLVEATIRMTIANTYASVGERQLAIPHLERAVALRKTHLGPDDPDTLGAMLRLAAVCREVGRIPDAIRLYKQILENREARLGPDDPETLARMRDLATTYDYDGQWGMSLPLLKQVLEKQRVICGPAHPDTLNTMNWLALNYTHVDQFHESIALHEKILELRKSTDDPDCSFLVTYAIACQGAGKLDQAAILLHKALGQNRKRDDSGGVTTAYTLSWLARNLLLQERYAEAEPIAREAIAIYEKQRPEDPTRFYFVSILGDALCGQKNYTQAEPLLLQGYEGMKCREALLLAVWKRRMAEVGERVVHFYEATNQPEKAREWREKVKLKLPDATSDGVK